MKAACRVGVWGVGREANVRRVLGQWALLKDRTVLQKNWQHSGPRFGHDSRNGYEPLMHGTTILSVRKDGKVVIIGDGQISLGSNVVKHNAKKVRKIGDGSIITGFAGSTADAITLLERLEKKIEQYPAQMSRACVELAKLWRTDKFLRRLEAVMIVADKDTSLTLTGNGDVIEPNDGIIAIGSGGTYALAAARALIDVPGYSAEDIARKAMDVASDICVYTNKHYTIEILEEIEPKPSDTDKQPSEGKK